MCIGMLNPNPRTYVPISPPDIRRKEFLFSRLLGVGHQLFFSERAGPRVPSND